MSGFLSFFQLIILHNRGCLDAEQRFCTVENCPLEISRIPDPVGFAFQVDIDNQVDQPASVQAYSDLLADIVILTVLPEEYKAVYDKIANPRPAPMSASILDLYAWKLAEIPKPGSRQAYSVALGMIGRAGTSQGALATKDAIALWKPRYIFFVGVGGGLELGGLQKGDVVIADVICGYEYGKVEREFQPRHDWTFRTDLALLNGATAFATLHPDWINDIGVDHPEQRTPKVFTGRIASGDKVVDDPTNEFFASVMKAWSKLQAVEMEGAGIAAAIEQAQSSGATVGFLVIRGICDMPRPPDLGPKVRGTQERDAWRVYAASAAATLAVSYIAESLPVPPGGSVQDKRLVDASTDRPATLGDETREAIFGSRLNQASIVRKFMAHVANEIDSIGPSFSSGIEPDELLVQAIEDSTELVIEFAHIAQATAEMDSHDAALTLYKGFGNILRDYDPTANSARRYRPNFHRFIGHELFVSFLSFLIQENRWETITSLLDESIYVEHAYQRNPTMEPFYRISQRVSLLEYRNRRLAKSGVGRACLHAHILNERHIQSDLSEIVPMQQFMDADFFLFLRSNHWRPWSTLYIESTPRYLLEATSTKYAERLLSPLDVENVQSFRERLVQRATELREQFRIGFFGDFWCFDPQAIGSR